jgi:hypothetical protein
MIFEEKNDLNTYCEKSKEDETKLPEKEKVNSKNVSLRFINRQNIIMNNYKKSHIINKDFIIENIFSNDKDICDKIYDLIDNPYQKKINLINMILNSDIVIPLKNVYDVIKFFNWLSPLNIEYKMGSKDWNKKAIKYGNKEKILLQNSISKTDIDNHFKFTYIDKIKKILSDSKVDYTYFEFKSKRFTKTKDIIWAFDKN